MLWQINLFLISTVSLQPHTLNTELCLTMEAVLQLVMIFILPHGLHSFPLCFRNGRRSSHWELLVFMSLLMDSRYLVVLLPLRNKVLGFNPRQGPFYTEFADLQRVAKKPPNTGLEPVYSSQNKTCIHCWCFLFIWFKLNLSCFSLLYASEGIINVDPD